MKDSLPTLSIAEAAEKLAEKEISALELARAYRAAIEKRNPSLNAYLEVFDDIETQAKVADERRAAGENHPLLGIPLAIKDNILIDGHRVSAASKMLENYRASYDATVIKKLKKAGTVFLGRTNMDEFALGGSTENSAFGVTKNPHDPSRVAGGTSGGSAAAVAANMCIATLGSDTGGAVRNPAAYCGGVGLKPTYGAVSRSGLIAAASSLDQIGVLSKTVADARILYEAIRGKDPLDSTSTEYVDVQKGPPKRIGVLRKLVQNLEKDMEERFDEALARSCAEIVDIDIPLSDIAIAAYYVINFAEVSTNLARFDGMRYGLAKRGENLLDDYVQSRTEGFGRETLRRILLGTFVLSVGYIDAYYRKADAARAALRAAYEQALKSVDVVATPTMPTPAFKIGEKSDPLSMYLEDIFTVTANLTGMPALSVPMGVVEREGKQLPVGIHFTALHQSENILFSLGEEVQRTS